MRWMGYGWVMDGLWMRWRMDEDRRERIRRERIKEGEDRRERKGKRESCVGVGVTETMMDLSDVYDKALTLVIESTYPPTHSPIHSPIHPPIHPLIQPPIPIPHSLLGRECRHHHHLAPHPHRINFALVSVFGWVAMLSTSNRRSWEPGCWQRKRVEELGDMTVNVEELISLQGGVTPICVLIAALVLANREDTYAVIILGLLYWVFLGLCTSSPLSICSVYPLICVVWCVVCVHGVCGVCVWCLCVVW